ncbi:hypothetical protein DNTS_015968, partial [Danionella cerebrum]
MEGDSVTLLTDVNIKEKNTGIFWMFENNSIAGTNTEQNVAGVLRDKDRVKIDDRTGSLTITNTRTTDSGIFTVKIIINKKSTTVFNVTVYASLPVPVISRETSCSSSSEISPVSKCELLCSVLNVSRVTLSWYNGTSLISSTSASDSHINLSLPLELEYEESNIYSCVAHNSIRNQTKHPDLGRLCQPCSGKTNHTVLAVAAGTLGIVAAVVGFENNSIAEVNTEQNISGVLRYKDRVKIDNRTGSLTITNTSTTDSGIYRVEITARAEVSIVFNVTVYASLPCSVLTMSRVTLSWYNGTSLISSTSASDSHIDLSLPLELEYEESNIYSCVSHNSIRNQTKHPDLG